VLLGGVISDDADPDGALNDDPAASFPESGVREEPGQGGGQRTQYT